MLSAYIYDFDQDEQGFIWMGTRNGLDRFDGYSVRNFRHDPGSEQGLSSNDIRSIAATSNGIVWAASHATGLDRFDMASETAINFRNKPGDPSDIGDDHVVEVIVDNHGDIWAATRNAGLAHIDHQTLTVTRYHTAADGPHRIPGNEIETVFADRKGRIWAGSNVGLIFAEDIDSGFKLAEIPASGLGGPMVVHVIREASNGTFILGTSGGKLLQLEFYERDEIGVTDLTSRIPPLEHAEDTDWLMDSYDRIWISTLGHMHVYDTVIEEHKTINVEATPAFEDRGGTIWLAIEPSVFRLDPNTLAFGDLVEELNLYTDVIVEHVFAVLETPNRNVWLSDINGVWRHKADTDKLTHFTVNVSDIPAPNDTNTLYQDYDGIVWAGTFFAGVNRIDPDSGRTKNYPLCAFETKDIACNRVWVIQGDDSGNIWVGSGENLLFFDRSGDSFRPVAVPDEEARSRISSGVRALAVGSDNTLWIGTQNGLLQWQRSTNAWNTLLHHPGDRSGLSSNYINALHEDDDGGLWIGTQLGAHRLDLQSAEIRRFNSSTGLPNDDIQSLIEDIYGTIWVSTGEGLASINKESFEVQTIDKRSGPAVEEFLLASGHAGKSGNVYFGGFRSLVYFDPKKLVEHNAAPQIALTELRINNEIIVPESTNPDAILKAPINLTDSIVLSPQGSSVAVDFAAMHYADPAQNLYSYMLVGYDDDWIHTRSDRRSASYTNLPFGEYTLRVKAANKDGVWNEDGLSFGITVLTPFWRAWWAYLLYGIAFVAAYLLIIRIRTRALANRATELEDTVTERTRQIREHEQLIKTQADSLERLLGLKEKLFTNISHEFRTPLTLILGPVNRLLQSDLSDKQESRVRLVKQNSQRLLRLVDQLLDLSRMDAEEPIACTPQPMSQIVRALADSFEPYARSRDIGFETDEGVDLWVGASADALEKILMNLLSNSFKYTRRGGHVSMRLTSPNQDKISLIVSDSGIGIAPEHQSAVFKRFNRLHDTGEQTPGAGIGLALVKELVEALGGSIRMTSIPSEGTTIRVDLKRLHNPAAQSEGMQEVSLSEAAALELEALSQSEILMIGDNDEQMRDSPTILIIEDNRNMREYLVDLLSPYYSCQVAGDGVTGLELGLDQLPDLVLCDVMLPRMDGYEVSQALKSDLRTSHIPIVMLTARGDKESRLLGLQEKVEDYVAKPFDDEELLLRIRNILTARDTLRKKLANEFFTNGAASSKLGQRDQKFRTNLNRVLEEHFSDADFRVDNLSHELAMSERHLQRKLKSLTGYTPALYLRTYRLKKAIARLQSGDPVNVIADQVGFSSPAYFASCFKEEFGVSPTEYLSGAKNSDSNSG